MKKHYGSQVRILHWCTDQAMTHTLAQMDLTAAQGHVISFLARCAEPPCPKDIEEAFHLSHPTVSGILARLEKKDFIRLEADPNDRRCKRIRILPKGQECNQQICKAIAQSEQRFVAGFTEEEKQQFSHLLERAIANMGGNPCCRSHKEEYKEQ